MTNKSLKDQNLMVPKFTLAPPNVWCKKLNEFLPSRLTNDGLDIDEQVGAGKIRYAQIQKGLWINQINLSLYESLEMIRLPKKVNDYFILNFHLSKCEIEQEGNGKNYKLGIENINILLSSATTAVKIVIPSKVPVKIFNTGFTKGWLEENILTTADCDLKSLFPENQPIYLSETIDYNFKRILKELNIDVKDRLKLFSNSPVVVSSFLVSSD